MSEIPPPVGLPEINLNYETPMRHGAAHTLVRLAGIFGLVSAGVDLIYTVGMAAMAGFMYYVVTTAPAGGPFVVVGPGAPPAPAAPAAPAPPAVVPSPLPPGFERYMILGMYGVPALLSLLALFPKTIGSIKLLRLRKRAWGWGLAAGITGCCQWWMLMGCCLIIVVPLSAGVYTIVILCLPQVHAYIAEEQAAHGSA